LIIDDHILFALLADALPAELEYLQEDGVLSSDVATTNCYYYRMLSALKSGRERGAFSGKLRQLPEAIQTYVIEMATVLPPAIQLIPMREMIPRMVDLSKVGINGMLRQEVLAAARYLSTGIAVARDNTSDNLEDAAQSLGIAYITV
jgi:hypothetical protein